MDKVNQCYFIGVYKMASTSNKLSMLAKVKSAIESIITKNIIMEKKTMRILAVSKRWWPVRALDHIGLMREAYVKTLYFIL